MSARADFFDAAGGHTPIVAAETDLGPYAVSTADHGLGRTIFLERCHPVHAVGMALPLLQRRGIDPCADGRVLLDVGAYTGSSTITALLRHGFSRAIAVEPEPANLRLLRINIALCGLEERVDVVAIAASSEAGFARLVVNPRMHGKHAVFAPAMLMPTEAQQITVAARPLDSLLDERGLDASAVGLMKLDVQGHEAHALQGAAGLLRNGTPLLLEWATDELEQNAAVIDLAAVLAEHYSWFIDLRAARDSGDTCGKPVPIERVSELAEIYPSIKEARRTGRPRVTDLLLGR